MCVMVVLALAMVIVPQLAFGEEGGLWSGGAFGSDSEPVYDTSYEEADSMSADATSTQASYEEESYSEDAAYEEESVEEEAPYYYSYSDYLDANGWNFGVDVSEWNGEIDWERVKADGVTFAIIRCGVDDGISGPDVDERFLYNCKECERLGIKYGVYFFSAATDYWEAATEGAFAASLLKQNGLHPDLPVFIDLELTYMGSFEYIDTLTEIASGFCETVEDNGFYPGVYASVSWWEYLLTDPCFFQWGRWVAQYDGVCEYAGTQWWQCTDSGWVDGIEWPVDLNYWIS